MSYQRKGEMLNGTIGGSDKVSAKKNGVEFPIVCSECGSEIPLSEDVIDFYLENYFIKEVVICDECAEKCLHR